MSQFFLLIDTSTEQGIVALFDGEKLLKEVKLPYGLRNSRSLLPELDRLFQEFQKRPQDLSFVAVGVGPGSYTGIRVGVVVAKMIHMTCKIPLVGVCSLKAYVPSKEGKFTALLDARVAGVYLLRGERVGERVIWLGEPKACLVEKLEGVLVTPQEKLKEKILGHQWEIVQSDGFVLGMEALRDFEAGKVSSDGHLDILYLRKTQAEIERDMS
ncbi:MAG: tRNA threonylcarbamoyladenosine biosynthesis protein TsaB [Chlamydiae bacterium]|nr:tRNA threonylcarbamoyladenosine biosynthesis protein TsaB [Chlamydiota bacterium]